MDYKDEDLNTTKNICKKYVVSDNSSDIVAKYFQIYDCVEEEEEFESEVRQYATDIQVNGKIQVPEDCEVKMQSILFIRNKINDLLIDIHILLEKPIEKVYPEEFKTDFVGLLIKLITLSDPKTRLNSLICGASLLQYKNQFEAVMIEMGFVQLYMDILAQKIDRYQEFAIILRSLGHIIAFSKEIYFNIIYPTYHIINFYERLEEYNDILPIKTLCFYSSIVSTFRWNPEETDSILKVYNLVIENNLFECYVDIITRMPSMMRRWPGDSQLLICFHESNIFYLINSIISGDPEIPNVQDLISYALDTVYFILHKTKEINDSKEILFESINWNEIKEISFSINEEHKKSALNTLSMLCQCNQEFCLNLINPQEFLEIYHSITKESQLPTKCVFVAFMYYFIQHISPEFLIPFFFETDILEYLFEILETSKETLKTITIVHHLLNLFEFTDQNLKPAFIGKVQSFEDWDSLIEYTENLENQEISQIVNQIVEILRTFSIEL